MSAEESHVAEAIQESAPAPTAPQGGILGQVAPPSESRPEPAANSDWHKMFSEEYQARPYLKEFKDPDSFIKSFENQRSLVGKRLEDMNEDQIRHYRQALGVPESPDKYQLLLPEGANRDANVEKWYRDTALEVGLPQKEAQALFERWSGFVGEQQKAQAEAQAEALRAGQEVLNQAYGSTLPNRLQGAVSTLRTLGGDELLSEFNNSDLASNPKMIQALIKVSELMSEDKGVSLTGSKSWGTAPSEAQHQIETLRGDPAFMERLAAKDRAAEAKWGKLFQLAYPE